MLCPQRAGPRRRVRRAENEVGRPREGRQGGRVEVVLPPVVDVKRVHDLLRVLLYRPHGAAEHVPRGVRRDDDARRADAGQRRVLVVLEQAEARGGPARLEGRVDVVQVEGADVALRAGGLEGVVEEHLAHAPDGEGCEDGRGFRQVEAREGVGESAEVGEVRVREEDRVDLREVRG